MSKSRLKRCNAYFRRIYKSFSDDPNRLTWTISAVWTIIMLVLLLLPGRMIPLHMVHNEDKLFHFGGFTVFSGLAVLCVRSFPRIFFMTHSSLVMAIGSSCGIVTEIMQQGVVGRTTSSADGVANVAGVLFGIILTNIIVFCAKKKRSSAQTFVVGKPIPRRKISAAFTERRSVFFYNPGPTP